VGELSETFHGRGKGGGIDGWLVSGIFGGGGITPAVRNAQRIVCLVSIQQLNPPLNEVGAPGNIVVSSRWQQLHENGVVY
jgi:hypothetical protein